LPVASQKSRSSPHHTTRNLQLPDHSFTNFADTEGIKSTVSASSSRACRDVRDVTCRLRHVLHHK